jgi:DeoR/GlpR family transcriptional regulator of sugar metabolism
LNEHVGSSERAAAILDAVFRNGRVQVAELADRLGTSEMTIRRDLEALEAQQCLRRVRGGAVAVAGRGDSLPFAVRRRQGWDIKQRLAERVGSLISDRETVILDNGTTCLAVAEALAGRPLTAVPLSLHAAIALGERTGARLVLPGGDVEPVELCFRGSRAVEAIRTLNVDVAVLSACAADPAKGLTSTTTDDADIKRAALAAAARTILVVESAKLTRTAAFPVASTDEVDTLVTTADADPAALAAYRNGGVDVVLV